MKKQKYNGTVVIDIDNVIADFEGEFCERFGYDHRELFNLEERYPKQADLIEEFVSDPKTYEDLLPLFGGVLLATEAHNKGFRVVLMTGRPVETKELTKDWLDSYYVRYDDLQFSKDKGNSIGYYNTIFPQWKVKMLVDDGLFNLVGLPAGVVGMAWDCEWNKKYYPRMRYNHELLRLECMDDTVSDYLPLWK